MFAAVLVAGFVFSIPKPEWVRSIGQYQLVKWKRVTPQDYFETLFLKDRHGRLVTALTEFHVAPLPVDQLPKNRDLDHDGKPDVVLTTYTGGAHASLTYQVWSLGKHPRCLLAYNKGNFSDQHDFEFVDLDHDGILEIRSWYDGFAYTVGASNWQNLPVVLKLVNGRYVDRTAHFHDLLAQATKAAWKDLYASDQTKEPPSWSGPTYAAVNLIALADLTHSRPRVWRQLKHELRPGTYAWLKKREAALLLLAQARRFRYRYAPAYSAKPVVFTQAKALGKAYEALEGNRS